MFVSQLITVDLWYIVGLFRVLIGGKYSNMCRLVKWKLLQ